MEYFELIPETTKTYIMTEYLYKDLFERSLYKIFFKTGQEFDNRFLYAISFGLNPRFFMGNDKDRFIISEEDDVTEIYFV